VGDGEGAGVGDAEGAGVGEGEGTGEGVGEAAGLGVGLGEAALVLPPHPAAKTIKAAAAAKVRNVNLILKLNCIEPPSKSWRLRSELLCLH
jgi:hypothetical protein